MRKLIAFYFFHKMNPEENITEEKEETIRKLYKDSIETLSDQDYTFKQVYKSTKIFKGEFIPTLKLIEERSSQMANDYLKTFANIVVLIRYLTENKYRFLEADQKIISLILSGSPSCTLIKLKKFIEEHIKEALIMEKTKNVFYDINS